MDTSAPEIIFDSEGVCNYCVSVRKKIGMTWFPDRSGESKLIDIFAEVRQQGLGSNQKFDSILGLSGGIDSAVVAKRAVDAGLRPLAVHVDGGWNTEASVENVRKVVQGLNLTLETIVIDWEEMRSLQLAFLKSGTLNQDIPQDHAFFVSLYRIAIRKKIPVILSGLNYATESVEPKSWGYSNSDGKHLLSVNSVHGSTRLKNFPVMDYRKFLRLGKRQAFKVIRPLDHGVYDPEKEKQELQSRFGWRPYGGKHSESLFTDWFQSVYMIDRYGIDKRRGHLASRVISGLISREDAMSQLSSPPVNEADKSNLNRSVAEKLHLTLDELDAILEIPHVSNHAFGTEFKSWLSP